MSLIVSSCSSPPERPNPEICIINYPQNIAYCGHPKGLEKIEDLELTKLTEFVMNAEDLEEKPLEYLHRGISFTPLNWELVQTYMDKLREHAESHCR